MEFVILGAAVVAVYIYEEGKTPDKSTDGGPTKTKTDPKTPPTLTEPFKTLTPANSTPPGQPGIGPTPNTSTYCVHSVGPGTAITGWSIVEMANCDPTDVFSCSGGGPGACFAPTNGIGFIGSFQNGAWSGQFMDNGGISCQDARLASNPGISVCLPGNIQSPLK